MCFFVPRRYQDGHQRILGRRPARLGHAAEIVYRETHRKQRQGERNPGQEFCPGAVSAR
jgi:hypothetical protein